MKRSTKLAVAIAAGTLGIGSIAGAVQAWSTFGVVTNVYAGRANKSIIVYGPSNVQGCANPGIHFSTADSDTEAIRALALSSMMSGAKLRCLTDGCVPAEGNVQRGLNCELWK